MGATACDLASELVRKKKEKNEEKKIPKKKKQTKKTKQKQRGKTYPGYSPHDHVPLKFSHAHLFNMM